MHVSDYGVHPWRHHEINRTCTEVLFKNLVPRILENGFEPAASTLWSRNEAVLSWLLGLSAPSTNAQVTPVRRR